MSQSMEDHTKNGSTTQVKGARNAICNGGGDGGRSGTSSGSKQKQKRETELKLVMEPQNPSPTKYFDKNGIALRREVICNEQQDSGSEPKTKTTRKRTKLTISCHRCMEVFDTKLEYEFHFRSTYNEEPFYVCPICNKQISQYKAFRLHHYRHTNSANQRYTCRFCSKVFHQKSDLNRHESTHQNQWTPGANQDALSSQNKISCDKCDAVLCTQAELRNHKKKIHPSPKQMTPCPECGKMLSAGSLYSHRKIHSNGPKYTCDECDKTFVQKINLIHHRRKHLPEEERPYPCGKCAKAFHEKSHLQRHSYFHSDERPFICETCGRTYKTERCLKVHSLVHSPERPFVCPVCKKGFLSSSKLRQHSNIHSGLRPHECPLCPRSFTNYPNWLKHIRRRHKIDHRTGEKLSSMPKFMTKKKDKVAKKKADSIKDTTGEKQNEPLTLSIKEESLPFVEENSNIDLNLVSKEDLLQPLKMEDMEDIFSDLPESVMAVSSGNACNFDLKIEESVEIVGESIRSYAENELIEPPLGLAADDNDLFQLDYAQPGFDCEFSIRHELLRTEAVRVIRESEAATSDGTISPPEPVSTTPSSMVYDMNEFSFFPTLISLCDNDQQYRLINPNSLHLPHTHNSSADGSAGSST